MKRTSIFLDEADRLSIEIIKERYGLSTDSDAIRLALRLVSQSPIAKIDNGGDENE